ncbi:MAG: DNA repair protein RecO, partial [Pseudomonadota bacterium]
PGSHREASTVDVLDALTLTGYFLHRDAVEPRGVEMPESRTRLIGYLAKRLETADDDARRD